jgi:ectoine hydroxylase-related dioxygenase (phytanoyl-CoA dioxygenase family)
MDLPNIDNGGFEIKQWKIEPGDVVAFNFKTIHSAKANTVNRVSRTLSFRLIGDDVRYRQRPGRTSPNFPDINQKNGERLREDWFPTIWSN